MAGSPPPTKTMIIRHTEKPPKHSNQDGPWDVLVNGQSGNGASLIVPGWQRAGALNTFLPRISQPLRTRKSRHRIISMPLNPSGETHRPCETV
ncbi:MAG TPA: hypothetical protein VK692_08000, partial [Chthoniobacterales bacterium]|nr:hypothetical protein [Chthoniobacterales bacterium]